MQELSVIAERLAQAHPESDKNNGFHIEPTNAPPPRGKNSRSSSFSPHSPPSRFSSSASRAPTLRISCSHRERNGSVRWPCASHSEPHARSFSASFFSKASSSRSREAPSESFSPYGRPMRSPLSACPFPSR